MPSPRSIAAAALVAATMLTTTAEAGAAQRRTCDQAGGTTVAGSASIRVFAKQRRGTRLRTLYGCHRRSGRPVTLGYEFANERWFGIAIGGDRYVGVVNWRWAPVDGVTEATISVYDMRTRRTVSRAGGAVDWESDLGMDPPQDDDLVVTRDGTAAYLFGDEAPTGDSNDDATFGPTAKYDSRLLVLERGGRPQVIDTAPNAEGGLSALALTGNRLYWLHGTTPRSHTL
jgi:hypothetical protein